MSSLSAFFNGLGIFGPLFFFMTVWWLVHYLRMREERQHLAQLLLPFQDGKVVTPESDREITSTSSRLTAIIGKMNGISAQLPSWGLVGTAGGVFFVLARSARIGQLDPGELMTFLLDGGLAVALVSTFAGQLNHLLLSGLYTWRDSEEVERLLALAEDVSRRVTAKQQMEQMLKGLSDIAAANRVTMSPHPNPIDFAEAGTNHGRGPDRRRPPLESEYEFPDARYSGEVARSDTPIPEEFAAHPEAGRKLAYPEAGRELAYPGDGRSGLTESEEAAPELDLQTELELEIESESEKRPSGSKRPSIDREARPTGSVLAQKRPSGAGRPSIDTEARPTGSVLAQKE